MGTSLAKALGILPIGTLVFFLFIALMAACMRRKWSERLESQRTLESLRSLTWQQFESLVAEAYRRKGYAVEQFLGEGADGGIDLLLRKHGETTLVQCKRWRTLSVGVPVIREQFGLLMHEQAQGVIVVTSGAFTPEARAFAAGKPIDLIDGPQLLELVRSVQTQSGPPSPAPPAPSAPPCPKCGKTMVKRTAKRGARAGSSFWGCPSFPACNGVRDLDL